jgi:hypothetical protein
MDGFNNKVEVIMWHGRIKLGIGIWLILSGFISPLHNPINMVFIGFVTAICCFNSYRIWQAAATGIVGLWLFLSGLHDIVSLSPRIMVNSLNFFFSGIALSLLGLWCVVIHSREISEKGYLKVG